MGRICFLLCLTLFFGWIHGLPRPQEQWNLNVGTCGYESCNPVKEGMINVHIVPHTHDDVGWLNTVDQYYQGPGGSVQYILDSVIPELEKNPLRRFIYVEVAFVARWWREQNNTMKMRVQNLVNEGRLEFILGGWCMNDEATTHYNAIIDQHTLGFEFLRKNFGHCGRPRIAWQIDPFGHSREQASLFAQFGFDGLYFGRLDYQDKSTRLNSKTMEMVWEGSPKNLGEKAELFTGALYNGYGPPGGFCFDIFCRDPPIMDDKRLHDYNVQSRVTDFLKAVNDQAGHYITNNIIMTMGSDFQYSNAHTWYNNLDKLLKYVNEQQFNGSKVNLLYSTPSCYTYQLNKAGKTWTTKKDDFFPYANNAHSFWTGYFTSRPTLKYYSRWTNNFLQVVMQIAALSKLDTTRTSNIEVLKEAMGVTQHHDAISGTEKQVVAFDYAERVANGVNHCTNVINDAYKVLLAKSSTEPPDQKICTLLNISYCTVTEKTTQFQVFLYNPIGRPVNHYARIPVTGLIYRVTGPNGEQVPSQVMLISPDTGRIPERNGSIAKYDLIFFAKLPPLGFNVYFVEEMRDYNGGQAERTAMQGVSPQSSLSIGNGNISLVFDGGILKQMKNLQKGITINLNQEFRYYTGYPGNNSKPEFQASGAYIFRPLGSSSHPITPELTKIKSYMAAGELVQEVYQQFSPWASQVIRVYEHGEFAEFQWTIGSIPIADKIGKEIISVFKTDLATHGVFYTDSNGREILTRKRNFRPTWKLNVTEPVAGNYYPVNTRIYLQDQLKNIQFTVLTDRSEGGTSLQDGSLELMVHRRLLYDDSRGVGEPLDERGENGKGLIVRGSHYVFLDTIESSAALHRDFAEKLYMAPSVSFTTEDLTPSEWSEKFHTNWTALSRKLPDNVHLLTLDKFPGPGPAPAGGSYLLRLEHFYEKGEDEKLSKPASVQLKGLFKPLKISSVEELTLGANLPLSDLHRLKWKTRTEDSTLRFESKIHDDPTIITLNPMAIRTFRVDVEEL